MCSRLQVPTPLAEHEVIADVESTTTEESTIVRVSPTSTGLLSCHVTGELRDVQPFRRDTHQERVLLGNGEPFECVHIKWEVRNTVSDPYLTASAAQLAEVEDYSHNPSCDKLTA
jgi:hypothetical protein